MVGKYVGTDTEAVVDTLRDREYFAVLIERYEAKLDRYLRRLGVREARDRQDVLQDIFIKVYRNLRAFDQSLSFSSWIYRIAHNEAVSWFRRRSARPEHGEIADGESVIALLSDNEDDRETVLVSEEIEASVRSALGRLPERDRDVLLLRFFEEKTYEEIADILEMPVGTVATLVHRAKAKLKTLLNETELS